MLTGWGAFQDRLSDEGTLWERSALKEEKAWDNYAYPVKTRISGLYDTFRSLEAWRDRRVS